MIFEWVLALSISVSVCVLLAAITITFKIKFTQQITKNIFTIKPYYLTDLYLLGKIVEHWRIWTKSDGHTHF